MADQHHAGATAPCFKELTVEKLTVKSPGHASRIELCAYYGEPYVRIYDRNNMLRAEVGLSTHNAPELTFYDGNGFPRLRLDLTCFGDASLTLLDAEERERVWLTTGPNQNTSLNLYGPEENTSPRLEVGLTQDRQAPFIELRDEEGEVAWSAPAHDTEGKEAA